MVNIVVCIAHVAGRPLRIDPEGRLGGRHLRFRAGQPDETRWKSLRLQVLRHRARRVARRVDGNQDGLDIKAGGLGKRFRQHVHARGANVRAVGESEINHRWRSGEVRLRDASSV